MRLNRDRLLVENTMLWKKIMKIKLGYYLKGWSTLHTGLPKVMNHLSMHF